MVLIDADIYEVDITRW